MPTSESRPALASEIRALLATEPPRRGYRAPRVAYHLGKWVRTTDFYPDFQTRLYDRRAARWRGKYVHESVSVDGPVGPIEERDRALLVSGSRRPAQSHQPLHHAGRAPDARSRTADGRPRTDRAPAGGVPAQLHPSPRASSTAPSGLTISLINAYSVFLKFAKLREIQKASGPEGSGLRLSGVLAAHRHSADVAGRSELRHADGAGAACARASGGARRASGRRAVQADERGARPHPARAARRHRSDRRMAAVAGAEATGARRRLCTRSARRGDDVHGALDCVATTSPSIRGHQARRLPAGRQFVFAMEVFRGGLLHRQLRGRARSTDHRRRSTHQDHHRPRRRRRRTPRASSRRERARRVLPADRSAGRRECRGTGAAQRAAPPDRRRGARRSRGARRAVRDRRRAASCAKRWRSTSKTSTSSDTSFWPASAPTRWN